MKKIKSFLLAALMPLCFAGVAIFGVFSPIPQAWNFALFATVMLATLCVLAVFAESSEHAKLTNAVGRERTKLLAKAKTDIEKWTAKQFKGRGIILGMLWAFYIAILVYAGALVLAGIIAMSMLLMVAGMKKFRADYELLKDLGQPPQVPANEKSSAMAYAPPQ